MKRRILFIGGTGTISSAITRLLLAREDVELYLLNRGSRNNAVADKTAIRGTLHEINCDINDEAAAKSKLDRLSFDVVGDFIAFGVDQVERDFRLFAGKTRQYIFISSASAYQKPAGDYLTTEATVLSNPFWEYSRNKAACEDFLVSKYRECGFPITIVRPSHTYDERSVPLGVHGKNGSWAVIKRINEGKPVIIHGDGTSLWTITHNSDFARAYAGLLGNIHAIGQAVQIMSRETVTWNQIYQSIADALGKPLNAVHVSSEFLAKAGPGYDFTGSLTGDKASSVVFDTSRLERLVPGFHAEISAAEGIRATVEYVLSHAECQKDDPEFDTWCDKVIGALDKAAKEIAA